MSRPVYIHADLGRVLADVLAQIENPEGAAVSVSVIITMNGRPFMVSAGDVPQPIRDAVRGMTPDLHLWLGELPVARHGWHGPWRGDPDA